MSSTDVNSVPLDSTMPSDRRASWIKQIPIFAGAELESLELFAVGMIERKCMSNELICRQGDQGDEVYLIVDGDLKIHIEQDGRVAATEHVGPGNCVGEMAVLANQPRCATVKAGDHGARLLVIPGGTFRNLLLLQPAIAVRLLAMMSERFQETKLRKQNVTLAEQSTALKAENEAARAASRAKSDFLAAMSHEIRTPLNGVIGLTELVLDTQLTHTQREYLAMVRESGESLLALINDILDFSKIEAGRLELAVEPFDLRDRLGDTLRAIAIRAQRKGLEFAFRVRPDVPDRVVGDVGRIRQILLNLVGNAVKFTERGEIVVEVSCFSLEKDTVELHFVVRDTGIGIPKEKCLSVFLPYRQAESDTTKRYGGTGLGLTISRDLVELMDGRIWAESTVGQGSEFQFQIRLGLADQEEGESDSIAMETARCECLSMKRALVVDDNATTREIVQEMLDRWRVETQSLADPASATAILDKAIVDRRPFSFVLIDTCMPGIDSFRLVDELRDLATSSAATFIMLVSGDQPGNISRCDELELPHLLKPIKQSELFESLVGSTQLSAGGIQPSAVAKSENPGSSPTLRILLAEDSLINQKLAIGLLERAGHSVAVAGNGKEAIAALEAQRFDLVLMDVLMPEMDGLEAVIDIRAREQQTGQYTPVIAMTAHAMPEDRQRCLEAGMDGYIAKPIRKDALFQTIDAIMNGPSHAVSDTSMTDTNEPIVDWELAIHSAGGGSEQLTDLVDLLLEECPRLTDEMATAVDEHDHQRLSLAAHTLRSSAGFIGARRVIQHSEHLERIGKSATFGDQVPGHLISLQTEISKLIAELRMRRAHH